MNTYSISIIELGGAAGEVAEAKVHRGSKNDDGSIGLDRTRTFFSFSHRTTVP